MTTLDITNIPTLTLKQVQEITYYELDITKSGLYRIMSGSRGYLEEIEYIDSLEATKLKLPSKEQCMERILFEGADEEEIQLAEEVIEEFYFISVEKDRIEFGFTEEEFDYYFKIKV
jgi:hypothetical protein